MDRTTGTTQRLGRRRLLAGIGATGFAVLFASACRGESTPASASPTIEVPTPEPPSVPSPVTAISSGTESASTSMPSDTNPFDDYTYENVATNTQVRVWVQGDTRYIQANGLPDHATGTFPNANNPNAISAQSYAFEVPAAPTQTGGSAPNGPLDVFGIAINGVPFDPGAAEFWNNDFTSGWQIEPLSGALDLGVDASNAHVQPTGGYHYHGVPEGIVTGEASTDHSPLVGFAADGFPIYARHAYADAANPSGGIAALRSGYRVKSGSRPSGPGGAYDGSYVADYEWVDGLGDLDANNGRFGVTPEYPVGTYYYVLTDAFPYIPRSFAGTPDAGFARNTNRTNNPPAGGGPAGRPPRR